MAHVRCAVENAYLGALTHSLPIIGRSKAESKDLPSCLAYTGGNGMHPTYADDGWIAIVILLLVLILLAVTGHLKL